MNAHAIQVARRVARIAAGQVRARKLLFLKGFPTDPPQYDIVLM